MPRYIDAEALTAEFKRLTLGENSLIERIFADGAYAVIDTLLTADVVSRERYDRVMDNLKSVLAERAEEKSEVAREIFAEIEEEAYYMATAYGEEVKVIDYDDLAELKKKYTEGEK